MKRVILHAVISLSIALAALAPVSRSGVRAQSAPLMVVISSATDMTNIDSSTLRSVFESEAIEFTRGHRFIPLNLPIGNPLRERFDRAVLDLAPDEVGRFWIDRRIRDRGDRPRTVPSMQLAIRVVATLPGAITYTTSDLVNSLVRVLAIDGKRPGEVGYLLR